MIEIFHDSVDISNLLISYNRQQEMCSGIGTLDLVIVDKDRTYFPWDFIELFEGGRKKGEYYIVSVDDDKDKGTLTISAQDGSKKLSDYFIDDQYTLESEQSARSLITKYLNMAGVSYEFTAGDGVSIGKGASFGMSSAFDAITTILQYSGWYMYFNPINTCIIGTLDTNPGSAKILTDSTITYIKVHKNDDMLRNKAVVWGGTEYPDGGMVHVSRQVITPWNYDENDLRTVVISNGMIRDYDSANTMASRLMQEFPRLTIEKEINIAGTTTLSIGDSLNVDSKWWEGSGLVTTHAASFSTGDGFQTNIILDQRCPRLFGFWKEYPIIDPEDPDPDPEIFDYVYIGTWGAGVWRKGINDVVWSNYSYGLGNLLIKDLFVKEGVAVCVADDGYAYTRTETEGNWNRISHGEFTGLDGFLHPEEDVKVAACTMNDLGAVILGANFTPALDADTEETGDRVSLIIGIDPVDRSVGFTNQVTFTLTEEGEDPQEVTSVNIYDVESYGASNTIVTTEGHSEGVGYKTFCGNSNYGPTTYNIQTGNQPTIVNSVMRKMHYDSRLGAVETIISTYIKSAIFTDRYDENILYGFSPDAFFVFNIETMSSTRYGWAYPPEEDFRNGPIQNPTYVPDEMKSAYMYQKSETEFVIFQNASTYHEKVHDHYHLYKIDYTIGDVNLNAQHIQSFLQWNYEGSGIVGKNLIIFGTPLTGASNGGPHQYNLSRSWIYDIEADSFELREYHVIDEVADGGSPTGWTYIYGNDSDWARGIIMGGDGSITISIIYIIKTAWHYVGSTVYYDAYDIKKGWWKYTADEDGNLNEEYGYEEVLDSYGKTSSAEGLSFSGLIHYGAGVIMQLTINDDGAVKYLYGLDDKFKVVGRKFYPKGSPVDDVMLTSSSVLSVISKYNRPLFIKRSSYKYIFQNLNLDIQVFEDSRSIETEYGHTVNAYLNSVTGQPDEDDGTFWVYAANTSIDGVNIRNMYVGFQNIGGWDWRITKEYIPKPPYYSTSYPGYYPHPVKNCFITRKSSGYINIASGLPSGNPPTVLNSRNTGPETMTFLHRLNLDSKVEISKGSPIVVYQDLPTDAIAPSEIVQNSSASAEGWSPYLPEIPIYDIKMGDIIQPATFPLLNGDTGNTFRWGFYGTIGLLSAYPASLSGDKIDVESFSGPVSKVETTNFNGNPYLFVAVSGVPTPVPDDMEGNFLQRGQNEAEFINQTAGLPGAAITIIRVDDRL